MCSNSRNDVAQRYGTIAAHTRRRASVLVVFVVFCVHMYSFAGLIRRTPPPTFSDTAITDRYSDTTIFQLRAHWVRISWSIDRKNRPDMCPRWESNPRLPACKASTLSTRPGSPLIFARRPVMLYICTKFCEIIWNDIKVDMISILKITKGNNSAKRYNFHTNHIQNYKVA